MNLLKRIENLPLTFRFSLVASLLVILTVVIVTTLFLNQEREAFREELEAEADLLLLSLARASDGGLYDLDAFYLTNLAEEIGTDQILNVSFYDESGRLVADNIGDADVLFAIEPNETGQNLLSDNDTALRWEDDRLFAGRSVQLGDDVVGAVSLELSTERIDSQIESTRNQGIVIALIVSLLASVIGYFLSRSIASPIRELATASGEIAKGNYNVQLEQTAGAEIGTLVNSFNTMTEAIQSQTKDLRRATREAQEASRLKDEFLSVMSHELRTPLNAMIGFLGIVTMTEKDLTEKGLHRVTRARANSERLLDLINDILDISRIESGRLQLVHEPLDIQNEINDIEEKLGVLAEEKGLKFIVNIDESLPKTVSIDEDAFDKIVTNLVGNAIKFTEEGSVELALEKDNDHWLIKVSDTGVGIPAHMHQIIFERFRQVDGSTKRKFGGSGLGLAITSSLINAIGGTIGVDSIPNEGATFTVRLPFIETSKSPQTSQVEKEVI